MITVQFPYASSVELVQLLLALIAVALGFWRLWVSVENAIAITDTAPGDLRRLVAETLIFGELFRLFMYGCLLAIGVISVLLPPPEVGYADSLQSLLVRFGLITLTLAMIADSLVQEYRRRLFYEQIVRQTSTDAGSV